MANIKDTLCKFQDVFGGIVAVVSYLCATDRLCEKGAIHYCLGDVLMPLIVHARNKRNRDSTCILKWYWQMVE